MQAASDRLYRRNVLAFQQGINSPSVKVLISLKTTFLTMHVRNPNATPYELLALLLLAVPLLLTLQKLVALLPLGERSHQLVAEQRRQNLTYFFFINQVNLDTFLYLIFLF